MRLGQIPDALPEKVGKIWPKNVIFGHFSHFMNSKSTYDELKTNEIAVVSCE